ncbi:AlpA family transcriptional regulator [Conchiformibius steedae DSM 2580]|uniref:AlpA family transcriptional regulator n=1 Tax=Conchiformibius steedae DSM 2580 TaxID=1121352 RepID=A0AAE9KZI3_9NEIS|nr:AlpA family transcriptional regulator [Conchiformibius steedae]QMT34122.1 AlpA family transcriptional regulator [Conchiformibius steedae]URD66895.1 AlpA family transcriptional regulator [Conchiformibius steedae DSM 2580]
MNEIVFLRMPEMMKRTGLSRAAIYCKANPKDRRFDPHFPQPVKITDTATGWVESEVNAWLAHRIAVSRQKGGKHE